MSAPGERNRIVLSQLDCPTSQSHPLGDLLRAISSERTTGVATGIERAHATANPIR